MKIFIDTANLADIEEGLKRGFASGVTTNPSLLSKEPKSSFEGHVGKIIDLIKQYQPGAHLSVEVFSTDPDEILKQAEQFVKKFDYPQLSIKVQVGWDELATIKKLSDENISVNCTACMTVTQAMMAAHAGAKYVSLFWARIRDGKTQEEFEAQRKEMLDNKIIEEKDFDEFYVMESVRSMIDRDGLDTQIIAGSMRGAADVKNAGLAGAHIVTVPPKLFKGMMSHYKTDQVVEQFMTDFKSWLE